MKLECEASWQNSIPSSSKKTWITNGQAGSWVTISTNERNETVLTGFMTDQAELHGVLSRVRDLGLTLISVDRVHPDDQTPD